MSAKIVSLEPRLRARADLAKRSGPMGFGDVAEYLDAQRSQMIVIRVSAGDPAIAEVVLSGPFETHVDVEAGGACSDAVIEICLAGATVAIWQETFEMAHRFSDGSLMVVHAVGMLLRIDFDDSLTGHPAPVA